MDQQLLNRTRRMLKRRFDTVEQASNNSLALSIQHLLSWAEKHPIVKAIILYLDNYPGDHQTEINRLLDLDYDRARTMLGLRSRGRADAAESHFSEETLASPIRYASACLKVLRILAENTNRQKSALLVAYLTREELKSGSLDIPIQARNKVLHDLYEYIDEQLDSINAVNGLLLKYKQSVEWFQRSRFQQIINDGYEGKTGERALAVHLQQYIFDQGTDFIIEPSSASGEVDLLLDPSGQRIIIDAKLIRIKDSPAEIKKTIRDGFRQAVRYCDDYNQIEGFLVVFVCKNISIRADIESDGPFRYLKRGGRIIYYIEINIADRPTASESGDKEIEISREYLLASIEEQ